MSDTPANWFEPLVDRITVDRAICGGRPCVRGSVPVTRALERIAEGASLEEVTTELNLSIDDVRACCAFAARMLRSHLTLDVEPL